MKYLYVTLVLAGMCLAGAGIDRLNEETELPYWEFSVLSGDPNELDDYMRVLIDSIQDLTDDIITDLNQLTSVESGITATHTGEQGDKVLTAQINEVSTVANAGDAVTLPQASIGRTCIIINNGANTLEIWPFEDDNAGSGTDIAITLASGSNVRLTAYNSTNWESI